MPQQLFDPGQGTRTSFPAYSPDSGARPYDDEISLVDLVRVLLRRKYWLLGVFLLCTFASLFYAYSREPRYAFTTSIQLGEFGPNEFVTDARSVSRVIEDRILLSAKRAYLQDKGLESMPFDVSVTTAEGNSFINLVSDAGLDRQDAVTDFHQRIFNRLHKEHHSRLSIMERESDARLDAFTRARENEEQHLQVLEGFSLESTLAARDTGQNNHTRAASQGSSEGLEATLSSSDAALTMLLSQLQLTDKIGEQRERLHELKGLIREEESRRSWIKPTRVDDYAVASLSPIGSGPNLIIALGVILGGMLGLFVAFFVELVAKVREEEQGARSREQDAV